MLAEKKARRDNDSDGWRSEESLKFNSPSLPFLHSYSSVESVSSPPHKYNPVDDYILRVHPESYDRYRYVTVTDIKNWSWSQVRQPSIHPGWSLVT